ncbi:MAG: glycosyltransferase family 39 protein, partial [Alphaproteobacteria bacterium]|nr:glycosyltransferase family 39 protein [Alphaproteobacteria bacterium]
AVAALAALTLLRLAVAAWAPLSPDEAYYWVWSRALAPGYVDHPPMVALWIRAGTFVAGQGALGVRLLAPLAAALGSVLLAASARDLLPGRAGGWSAGIAAAALLNATLLLGVGAATMTPDTPLLLFWTASLWALGRLLRTGNGAWWLAAGAAAGMALSSKYTAILLVAAVGLWLLLDPAARPWLRRPWPWAGALLAALIFAPTLVWNARLGWPSFARQGSRLWAWEPGRAVGSLLELAGGQIGLATPLVFLLFAAGAALTIPRTRRDRDPAWSLLAAAIVLPALVFVQHALGDRVQANWPAVIYPAAAIAAAGLAGRFWRRLRAPAIGFGLALGFAVYLQAVAAPLALPRPYDPTLARLGGWAAFARDVDAARRAAGAEYVASEAYGDAAELAWLAPAGVPVIGIDPRWALFALPDARPFMPGRTGLLVQSIRRTTPFDAVGWPAITPVGTITRARDGVPADRYRLYRVVGPRQGTSAVVLPHR